VQQAFCEGHWKLYPENPLPNIIALILDKNILPIFFRYLLNCKSWMQSWQLRCIARQRKLIGRLIDWLIDYDCLLYVFIEIANRHLQRELSLTTWETVFSPLRLWVFPKIHRLLPSLRPSLEYAVDSRWCVECRGKCGVLAALECNAFRHLSPTWTQRVHRWVSLDFWSF